MQNFPSPLRGYKKSDLALLFGRETPTGFSWRGVLNTALEEAPRPPTSRPAFLSWQLFLPPYLSLIPTLNGGLLQASGKACLSL